MKQYFYIACAAFVFSLSSAFAASEISPTLDIALNSNFDSQFHCAWKNPKTLKFWIDPVEDARESKGVGILMLKDKETPLQSTRPVATLFQEALEKGLKKCGFVSANQKDLADVVVGGKITEFSGTSKKGLFKGKAEGKADFTLNLITPAPHEAFSITFGVEETQQKGISGKPKKLEKILNNLLTKLTLNVFESHQVSEWVAGRK